MSMRTPTHAARWFTPVVLAGLLALTAAAARADVATPRVSPNATVTQTIGITDFTVTYSRPGVKSRTIWGDLVPYDKPWRTGANDATTFTTTDDITVAGQPLKAGKYSFFTIPTRGDWTIIFSTQHDLWGAYEYDPAKDALRVTVTPTAADHEEWMRFSFENLTPNSAELVLRWEKLQVAVPIGVKVNDIVLAKARTELAAAKADDWRNPLRAAQFCFDNGVALDEGAKWLDQSLAIKKGYSNQSLKARWLAKDGKTKQAIAMANDAIAAGKAATPPADTSSLEKRLAEWQGGAKK
jgi:hypothetical protein